MSELSLLSGDKGRIQATRFLAKLETKLLAI